MTLEKKPTVWRQKYQANVTSSEALPSCFGIFHSITLRHAKQAHSILNLSVLCILNFDIQNKPHLPLLINLHHAEIQKICILSQVS